MLFPHPPDTVNSNPLAAPTLVSPSRLVPLQYRQRMFYLNVSVPWAYGDRIDSILWTTLIVPTAYHENTLIYRELTMSVPWSYREHPMSVLWTYLDRTESVRKRIVNVSWSYRERTWSYCERILVIPRTYMIVLWTYLDHTENVHDRIVNVSWSYRERT